jgi:hypothetical protein
MILSAVWHFKEKIMQTNINWFEIPSSDFARAVAFYESVFDAKLRTEQMGNSRLGVFTKDDGNSIGAVIHGERYVPGKDGPVLYMDAGPSIDGVLARIEPAGGRIQIGKTALPKGLGFIAYFTDTEGNRMALHAMA